MISVSYTSICTFLLVFLFYSDLFPQTAYIQTDSAYHYGVKLIPGNSRQNSRMIIHDQDSVLIKYSPAEIIGYGFSKDKQYVSKEITIRGEPTKVFLHRLEKGDISLYFYKDCLTRRFFLEKQGLPLVEIERKETGSSIQVVNDYLSD